MKVKRITESAILPTRGTNESAGLDLYVDLASEITIQPNEVRMIGTGLAFEIPTGCAGLIYPRSGISTKRGIVLANSVAVIDSDYRGEVMLPLRNTSNEEQKIDPHERVAQMIITPYTRIELEEVDDLSDTTRGTGGFGSTGSL